MDNINKNFSDIKNAFSILEGQDKLIHLIDLGKKIEKIDIEDKTEDIFKKFEVVAPLTPNFSLFSLKVFSKVSFLNLL